MPRAVFSDSDSDDGNVPSLGNSKGSKASAGKFVNTKPSGAAPAAAAAASSSSSSAAAAQQQQGQKDKAPLATIRVVTDSNGTDMPVKVIVNNKVFVDGLPYQEPAGGESLQEQLSAFCTAWKVGKVTHLTKKPGQGFGYIAFRSPNSVETAVAVLDGKKFLGRHLRVEVPKPPKPLRDHAGDAGPQALADSADYTRQVLISDLPLHAQPDILREVLADYCPALEKRVTKIKMTSRNRKAFVTLETAEHAAELQQFLHGFTVLGRRVEATMAQPPGAAPFAPQILARLAKEQEKKQEEEEKKRQAEEAEKQAAQEQRNAERAKYNSTRDIVGTNARKEFPMPMLIDIDGNGAAAPAASSASSSSAAAAAAASSSSSAAASKTAGKIRQRDEKAAPASSKPTNAAAAAAAASRLDLRGPRKIYVANLPLDITESRLRGHLGGAAAAAGKNSSGSGIRSVQLQRVGGVPNGIAVIEYTLPADARAAVERFNGSLVGGQRLEVELDGEADAAVHGAQGTDAASTIAELRRQAKTAELDEDDEDAYARAWGVKNRKKYLAGSDEDDEDEDEGDDGDAEDDAELAKLFTSSSSSKRGDKKAKSAPAGKPQQKGAKPLSKRQEKQQAKAAIAADHQQKRNAAAGVIAPGDEGKRISLKRALKAALDNGPLDRVDEKLKAGKKPFGKRAAPSNNKLRAKAGGKLPKEGGKAGGKPGGKFGKKKATSSLGEKRFGGGKKK